MQDKRGKDQIEGLIFERQGLVEISGKQARAPFQALLGDIKHARARIDPGHLSAALDEGRRMRAAAASGIKDTKTGNLADQGEDCRPFVIGIPGIRLVVGVIGRGESIIIILGQDFSFLVLECCFAEGRRQRCYIVARWRGSFGRVSWF